MIRPASLELLESRIAPALVVVNHLADILVGAAQTGKTIELSQMFDSTISGAGHTFVTFTLNLDSDPNTPGLQTDFDPNTPGDQPATFTLELYDDEAPLTVQNFLRYVESPTGSAEFLDTFFHRSVSGFVVQGGGFSTGDFGDHVPIFSEVHNEFSADRSNLRGTIAMAKTGLGPNTATSEWFVNLADNSSNLDNQNGGFTVFGSVVQGMEYFDKIATLTKAKFNDTLSDVPVQNFNPDPDNNSSTPAPTPGKDNLIRITDIHVQAPQAGAVDGVTYSAVSSNNSLVGVKIDGSKLNLTYNGKSSGVSTVTVTATKGGETVMEDFLVTLTPNLINSTSSDLLQTVLVPGDHGKVSVIIKNSGGGAYNGAVDVKFYLSKAGGSGSDDPNGLILDDTDILIGSVLNKAASIASGKDFKITGNLAIPTELIEGDGAIYKLLVDVKPSSATNTELFTDDNLALNGAQHGLTNQFGTFNFSGVARTNAKLTYTDPVTHSLVTLSMKGQGSGKVTLTGADNAHLANLLVSGTSLSSQVKLKSSGDVSFQQFDVATTIGKIDFSAVDITGDIAISGGIKTLVLGDVSGDNLLTIGAFPPLNTQKVSITLGHVTDFSIESFQPIASLKAIDWHDTTGADDYLISPSISSLKITGDKKAQVQGDLEANVTTYSTTKLGAISVAGLIKNATIKASGDIGSVTAGGIINSNVFAGTDGRPDALTDFTEARTIQSFTIKGLTGVANTFVDTQVAAAVISKIVVRGVDFASGDSKFGFVADRVGSYSRLGEPKLTKLDAAGAFDSVGNFELLLL